MAPALPAPTGTATVLLTLHELLLPPSANSFSPQWVDCSVSETMPLIAEAASAHFELAPQPPLHVVLLASSFIDPEASSRIRMSAGSGPTRCAMEAQMSRSVPPMDPPPPLAPTPVVPPLPPPPVRLSSGGGSQPETRAQAAAAATVATRSDVEIARGS